ncbi:MAG: hypothetical protein ABIY55_27265 [Kofleriaceae bacterium]
MVKDRCVVLCMLGWLAGCAMPAEPEASSAAVLAGRPESVPGSFVPTPSGWFHPSCVITVAPDEHVERGGTLRRADGGVRAPTPCQYPHFTRTGVIAGPAASAAVVAQGCAGECWVAEAHMITTQLIAFLHVNWTVPPHPAVDTGQVLYYFPGLQSDAATVAEGVVLQPVLRWAAGAWSIANWNCCANGNAMTTEPLKVEPGAKLRGDVFGSNCAGTTCGHWQLFIANTDDYAVSATLETDVGGRALPAVYPGVLEAFYLTTCAEYPPTPVTFQPITVMTYTNGWVPLNPPATWIPKVYPYQYTEPAHCRASVSVASSNSVTISVGTVP